MHAESSSAFSSLFPISTTGPNAFGMFGSNPRDSVVSCFHLPSFLFVRAPSDCCCPFVRYICLYRPCTKTSSSPSLRVRRLSLPLAVREVSAGAQPRQSRTMTGRRRRTRRARVVRSSMTKRPSSRATKRRGRRRRSGRVSSPILIWRIASKGCSLVSERANIGASCFAFDCSCSNIGTSLPLTLAATRHCNNTSRVKIQGQTRIRASARKKHIISHCGLSRLANSLHVLSRQTSLLFPLSLSLDCSMP